ncbi:TonB-dependent receptor [Porphyrobacter algicida]|uniref:TonB-dependent receptor n=2 Tax=Qipengyuania algicida TaxID=1836209 RepID=A0A845AS65_9SPHN|nr:TonB-dependent receptor [Qipengyuania algicida]
MWSTAALAEDVTTASATGSGGQTAQGSQGSAQASSQDAAPVEIVVTARKRKETLLDVPIAVTAISGDTIERRGLTSVKDVAQLTPGLSINSDAAGRAFISIRGVGVTLVDTVQPGVGIFLDGIYEPNTSYINNPLTDVERIEVLRGPQGTLYGKNTLGGAINVITRQPGNDFEGKVLASYAGPDNAWYAGGSLSGPIVTDVLQARIAYMHRQQDGFIPNTNLGIDANPLNTDSVNGTIRFEPVDRVVLTVNGYYDHVVGGTTPYSFVTGPTDYERNVTLNTTNYQYYKYKRANAKLEMPIDSMATNITLIAAYDERDTDTPQGDLDFSSIDIARNSGTDLLKTKSVEFRADTTLTQTLSTILGAFYSNETRHNDTTTVLFPGVLDITNRQISDTTNDTWAVFGNVFWRPDDAWELSAGLRYDRQAREALGSIVLSGTTVPVSNQSLKEDHVSPRLALTRHWSNDFMSYASIARGFRGGGFNPPTAPAAVRTYKGDNVWTYEIGSKYASPDRRISLTADIFYNDYKDYIGLNSIAPASTGGFTTVDLNTGDVTSYGAEVEASFQLTNDWSISGGASYQHARLTNSDIYTQVTGRTLSSDRLTFVPDWNFDVNTDYVVHLGDGSVTFAAGVTGKGSRLAATLNETTPTILDPYYLVNASVTYRHGGIEVSAFVDNAFQEKYFESYIEKTTLILAGLTPSDIGIVGDRRRIGVRTRITF